MSWDGDAEWFHETATWSWVVTATGERLHHLAEHAFDREHGGRAEGRSTCGIRGYFYLAGLFTRLGAERCSRCCDGLGWPRGIGSPKNDAELQPLVSRLLAAPTPRDA